MQAQGLQGVAVYPVNGIGMPIGHAGGNVANGHALGVENHVPAAYHVRNGHRGAARQLRGVRKPARLLVLRQRSTLVRLRTSLYLARGVQRHGLRGLRGLLGLLGLLCHGCLPLLG